MRLVFTIVVVLEADVDIEVVVMVVVDVDVLCKEKREARSGSNGVRVEEKGSYLVKRLDEIVEVFIVYAELAWVPIIKKTNTNRTNDGSDLLLK